MDFATGVPSLLLPVVILIRHSLMVAQLAIGMVRVIGKYILWYSYIRHSLYFVLSIWRFPALYCGRDVSA